MIKGEDIYFSEVYASCYGDVDKAEVCKYELSCEFGEIHYVFLKRKISNGEYSDCFDIMTPYGYGGPVILSCVQVDKDRLVKKFSERFPLYCEHNRIISEFVRFHPLINNQDDFKIYYNPEFNRHTVSVDLSVKKASDAVTSECRNKISKAVKNNVEIVWDPACEQIEDFYNIYTMTMKKNSAGGYYYFSKIFFSEMIDKLKDNIFLVHAALRGEIIASAMFLHSEKYVHYHFSGTNPNYYYLAANNLMIASVIQWGIEQGKKFLHLGGGLSSDVDDPLLVFKKSFSKTGLRDFYVGKKVYNNEIYDKLCRKISSAMNSDFFPLYRVKATSQGN
jgi:hypothetical protein